MITKPEIMNQNHADKKCREDSSTVIFLLSFIVTIVIIALLFFHYYPNLVTTFPIFNDIIIESTANTGINKSGEVKLFWILALSGFLFMSLLIILLYRYLPKWNLKTNKRIPLYSGIVIIPLLLRSIFLQAKTNMLYIALLYFAIISFLFMIPYVKKLSFTRLMILPVLIYYSVMAFLTVAVQFSTHFQISSNKIYLITSLITIVCFLFCILHDKTSNKITINTMLTSILLITQTVIPFLLVIYFVDHYSYKGEIITVSYSLFYYLFFGVLILLLIILSLRHLIKNYKEVKTITTSKIISASTVISVFIYNSFSAAPLYAQPDQHHHGEQLIPWQQIISLGRKPYEEYTPVSGLFPMVNGFIQNVLMRNTVSDYSPAISITMVLFCIITIYLVYKHVGGAYSLVFAIFFALPAYNRQYMVLPVLLLLFLPDLLKHPMHWIRIWIFTCFLAGLYYPLYGAGILLGTLPLGISMLLHMIRNTNWKDELKKPMFYVLWLLCLLPIVISLPLLYRMLTHTLTFSSQSILADGISLFGQEAPSYFLPWLADKTNIRQNLYLCYRFMLPMLGLFIFSGLIILSFVELSSLKKQADDNVKKTTTKQYLYLLTGLLAGLITLAVSYTYTLNRADTGMILSRTAPILIVILGIFLPVLLLGIGRNLISRNMTILFIGFCFSLPLIIYNQVSNMKFPDMWIYPNGQASLIMDDSSKLYSYYSVPETFIRMDEIDIIDNSKLGNGFMVADQISYLKSYENVIQKCKAASVDPSYMGFDGQGFFYYLNARACSTGFIQVARSYEAQQEILTRVKIERPIIFLLDPLCSYYIYYWVATNDYVYSAEDNALYPAEIYQKLYANVSASSLGDYYRNNDQSEVNLEKICNSFGNSFETLRPLFTDSLNASGINSVKGTEYDFIWMDFTTGDTLNKSIPESTQKLKINFTCDGVNYENSYVSFNLDQGRLLVPLGMNPDWLLSENTDITVSYLNSNNQVLQTIPVSELEETYDIKCEYLKIRQ